MYQGRSAVYVQVDEQLLKEYYKLNLPENQFLCTEEVCFSVWWYFCIKEHPTLDPTIDILCITKNLLSKFWSTFDYTWLLLFSNWPTYPNSLRFCPRNIKSNRYGLTWRCNVHTASITQLSVVILWTKKQQFLHWNLHCPLSWPFHWQNQLY